MLTYDDVPRELNLATEFVDRNVAEGRGEKTALIGPGGRTTYAELAALVNRSGHVLRELAVRAEERVLLVLGDSVELVALWYGAQKIGAVTAEAYTFLQPKDYAYYLDYTRAGVVVADATTVEPIREAARDSRWLRYVLVVGVPDAKLGAGEVSFEARAAAAPGELEPAPTTRDDVAIWKFTTGSTGLPKAAVHPQHSPVLSFDWYARGVLGIREDDVVLPVPKLFFGYARDLTALYPFGVGGAGIVFPERTTPERIFELVEQHRPTILVQVPTMMAAMVAHPDAEQHDLSCLRFCTSAGEALPGELYERWLETFGVEVLDGIGSSEAYHIYISSRPGRVRPGSVGELVPGYRARIVDEEGRDLPQGEVGTLWIEGDTSALLYWGEHEKTKRTFSGDLVRTGDLFVRDPDGFFWYRGRADELLKVGGIFVAPAEIEHCLVGHPDVVECAVVGYEEDGLTQARAHVVLRAGVEGSDELAVALREHVRAHLSPHKRPHDVRFVAELPKTPSGKIDRRALRSELEAVA
ncbi:MAG TPA: benzoate-CoA ligase family protein [Gaiellaceae bacterium]|nr:benzoate-CoA ligase family protein [Gaiellaceae bacterium]